MKSLVYLVMVIFLTGFSLAGSVRGSENILKSNIAEFTPKKVSDSNICNYQPQLPVASAADGDVLYLFNGKYVKIAKLSHPKFEKDDIATFVRVLCSTEIERIDINNQVRGPTYILKEPVIEDYKYKFSKEEILKYEQNFTGCDVTYNITYTKNDVEKLCQNVNKYINEKISLVVDKFPKYIYLNGKIFIQPQSSARMTKMINDISLDLHYFNSLHLYMLNEDSAVGIIKDYYYLYIFNNKYNDVTYDGFKVEKLPLNAIDDTEEMRVYSVGNIQCTQLKSSDNVGYCFMYDQTPTAAEILAYGDEKSTSLSESSVKSTIESYITERVNVNLDDIYNEYYRNLEECSGNIYHPESLPTMSLNNNDVSGNDYGSKSGNYYLTNKYVTYMTKIEGNTYYQRLVYDVTITNENECNSTITIGKLNDQSSVIFFSDSFRYSEIDKDKSSLEFKYYTCDQLKDIDTSAKTTYYEDYCAVVKNSIHSDSNCNAKLTGSTIALECEYQLTDKDGNKSPVEYLITFTKDDEGSKGIDRIVSESITSYPIPLRRSFILNDDFYSGDNYIGSIDEYSNSLKVEIFDKYIEHFSNYSYTYYKGNGLCLYMKPSSKDEIYTYYGFSNNNNFPLLGTSSDKVTFISKDEEFRILKNRTLSHLNYIFNYNTELDLVGQSGKLTTKDTENENYNYVVLLSDKKLSIIKSYKTEDGFDTYKLIYNIQAVNNNPYVINVTGLDYSASTFKLSNHTCYTTEQEVEEDGKKEECGNYNKIYTYNEKIKTYSKLNETILEVPFVTNIRYSDGDHLTIKIDDVSIYIYKKDKSEIDKKIAESLRTYKMKDHTYGIYSEEGSSISFFGVSPAYMFNFYYSDSINNCGITTNQINQFIETSDNYTTFNTETNDNYQDLYEFCFSARFDDKSVFCAGKSYEGNVLIDEYVNAAPLVLLPSVTFSSIKSNMSEIIDKCSTNFKKAINEKAEESKYSNKCNNGNRLLFEEEILLNVQNKQSKAENVAEEDNNNNKDTNTQEDVTTPEVDDSKPAINKTCAGYYETSEIESKLSYSYYGIFLTNTKMIIDVRYEKVNDNTKEKKYVYNVILYNDKELSSVHIQLRKLDTVESKLVYKANDEEKSFEELDNDDSNKDDFFKDNKPEIFSITNTSIILKNVGDIKEVNLTIADIDKVLNLSVVAFHPKPIPNDVNFFDSFTENNNQYYVYKVYDTLFVQLVYSENGTYLVEFGSNPYSTTSKRILIDISKISNRYVLLQTGEIAKKDEDNNFSAESAVQSPKPEPKQPDEIVEVAETKINEVSNEVKNEINSIPTQAPATEIVVEKEKSVGGNGIALIVIFTLIIIVVVAFVIIGVFVPPKYYSKYFNKSKVDEGDKPTYDPVEEFHNPAEVDNKPMQVEMVETKPVEEEQPKVEEAKPVEETTAVKPQLLESKPTDEPKPEPPNSTEESKPEEVKPTEAEEGKPEETKPTDSN